MAYEVNNKEINSQCAELLVRPTYNYNVYCTNVHCTLFIYIMNVAYTMYC